MEREYELKKHLVIAILMGAALVVAGCDKHTASNETVGQKVDKVIDKTQETAESIGSKIGETAKSGAETVQQKADQVGAIFDDSSITASIKADLIKDPGLSALKIDVNTVKGEVTLKGEADSVAARDRAVLIASAVTGVVKVNNLISIKG
jgi:hyperosmotically inducible protein